MIAQMRQREQVDSSWLAQENHGLSADSSGGASRLVHVASRLREKNVTL